MRQRPAIRIKSALYLLQKRKCVTTKCHEQTPKMSWAQPVYMFHEQTNGVIFPSHRYRSYSSDLKTCP